MNKHFFNDLLDLVLEERKNTYKSLRTASWERKISKRIREYFIKIYVEEVNELIINKFFSFVRFKEDGSLYSDKYLKAVFSLVKATMKKALLYRHITINPLDYDFKRPKGKITQSKKRFVSDEDLRQLLKCCKSHKVFRFIIPILLLTGMRIGEILGLYWTDIDFDNNVIYIRRAVVDNYIELPTGKIVKSGVKFDTPKTMLSERELPVSPIVISLFKEILLYRDLPENKRWKEKIDTNYNLHLIFPNAFGRVTNYNTLYDSLIAFLKKNNLENSKILFHKLRHNYAIDNLKAGADITIVSQLLGHANIQTTVNTYINDGDMELKTQAVKKHCKYANKYEVFTTNQ